MKRRIVELENGKWSYQFRCFDTLPWATVTTQFSSYEELLTLITKWKEEESTKIKVIHEEI